MKKVTLYTDGACSGNPGPGGWAAILSYGEYERVMSGHENPTTNNRMELTAVIEGLSALNQRCEVELFSDSKYVIDSVSKGWLYGWQKKGWKKSGGELVPNIDLWQKLLPLLKSQDINFNWVRGHIGNETNERCDSIAVAESKKAQL